ncbi:PP2C family protein-serine/threonine phosphatase [Butyrivibrio sp. NC2002]|uniref:PP2C family protein-serine/threonine phosphatase n=1 Tax=Butyrivibrio sp. NC2002 TaxID=1410610 RepID=UPI00068A893A|nr:PP2C family protein-serine/threonine phosphatase [Butyrivibrio sp. NC2002]
MGFVSKRRKKKVVFVSIMFMVLISAIVYALMKRGLDELKHVYIINISADIAGMLMAFVLYNSCIVDVQKSGKNLKFLLLLINVAFIGLFSDSIAWLVDGIPALRWLNILDNTVYYICAPVEACLFWLYTTSYLGLSDKIVTRFTYVVQIGLIISILFCVINLFTGFYFVVGPDGIYHRNPKYIFSMVYAFFTIISSLVIVTYERKRLERYQLIVFYVYAFAPFLVGILTALVYGLSLGALIIMLDILLIYCVLNVSQGREKAVADRELDLAARIQENVLPRIFPPFPERDEFDLYASMTPAREVGGDFYDFFMIDEDHLGLVIADVSGKGIPAALFMMITKALLKNQTMYSKSHDPGRILTKTNEQLCENNKVELFVTTWIGILTISTGELRYANAGHEYPAVRRAGESFEIIKEKHSPPLATFEGLKFFTGSTVLNPGDMLFIYTDGVAEATNEEKEMFGIDRMLSTLNEKADEELKAIDTHLRDKISEFVGEAPQFDDITMLCLKYFGTDSSLENK